jgi:hypothetical protein
MNPITKIKKHTQTIEEEEEEEEEDFKKNILKLLSNL